MAVPDDALKEAGISSWMGPSSLPLWIDDPSWRYFATLDTTRARARGVKPGAVVYEVIVRW